VDVERFDARMDEPGHPNPRMALEQIKNAMRRIHAIEGVTVLGSHRAEDGRVCIECEGTETAKETIDAMGFEIHPPDAPRS
jgi:hypothetical protein